MAVTRNRFIVDRKGKRVSVVVPVDEYEELLEDLHDLAVVAERRTEPAVPFASVKKRLKAGGLLTRSLAASPFPATKAL